MSNSILQHQCELVDKAKQLLVEHKQVGLDVFTRGGKSFIAMDLIEYLYDNHECRTFVYLAPKSIVNNQKTNTFKNFKYKNNITFISKEMMSRGVALEELIYSYGLNPDAVDVIIIDEAHTFFGKNIGNEVSIAKDYLHSKYIIAMTATPVNNLSGINSLASLVHRDCILHYTFDKAVEENVITKVKYIPAVLKYDKKCYEKLDNLCSLIESGNTYLINLYEELEQAVNVLNGSVEDKVFEYIKDRLTLNCSEGARVFTFFNTMDEVINNEQTVVNIITRLYRYWGNTDVTVNYHPYISCNSKTEDDSVLEVIGSESMPNTIDVIATVNKGALGIHPSNVHFGLVLCGTKSIPKYLQMIGRLTNLEYFDTNDTVIFDLRDNGSFLGNKSIYVGRQKTLNRRAITRERALTNLLGAELKQDLDKSVRLMPCEELEYTMSLFDRINSLITLTTGNEAIIKLLNNNLKTIDKLYNGNVSKFLEDKVKYFDGRGKKGSDTRYKNYKNMYARYNEIRKAIVFDGFTSEDRQIIMHEFGFLGYRLYIEPTNNDDTIEYIRTLYERFSLLYNNNRIKEFADIYYVDYLTNKMTTSCYALIQSNEKLTEKLINKVKTMIKSDSGLVDKTVLKYTRTLLNDLNNIKDSNYSWQVGTEILLLYKYIDSFKLDDTSEVYADNVIRYVDKFYGGTLENMENSLLSNDLARINKAVSLLIGYNNGTLMNLCKGSSQLEKTISMIARQETIDSLDLAYRIVLKLMNINSIKQFNTKVIPLTYSYKLVNEYAKTSNRDIITELESYLQLEDLPKHLVKKINSCSNYKLTYENCTDKDIKIAVQSLTGNNPKQHKRLLRDVLKNKTCNQEQVIMYAFSKSTDTYAMSNVSKFLKDETYDKKEVLRAINYSTPHRLVLTGLMESGVLSKRFNRKIDEMLKID